MTRTSTSNCPNHADYVVEGEGESASWTQTAPPGRTRTATASTCSSAACRSPAGWLSASRDLRALSGPLKSSDETIVVKRFASAWWLGIARRNPLDRTGTHVALEQQCAADRRGLRHSQHRTVQALRHQFPGPRAASRRRHHRRQPASRRDRRDAQGVEAASAGSLQFEHQPNRADLRRVEGPAPNGGASHHSVMRNTNRQAIVRPSPGECRNCLVAFEEVDHVAPAT